MIHVSLFCKYLITADSFAQKIHGSSKPKPKNGCLSCLLQSCMSAQSHSAGLPLRPGDVVLCVVALFTSPLLCRYYLEGSIVFHGILKAAESSYFNQPSHHTHAVMCDAVPSHACLVIRGAHILGDTSKISDQNESITWFLLCVGILCLNFSVLGFIAYWGIVWA